MKINTVILSTVLNYGMRVHLPESIVLSVLDDGKHFQSVDRKINQKKDIFARRIQTGSIKFIGLEAERRYLKNQFY